MKIVMSDLNAKVRSDNTNHDRAKGKEGCGSMNNGERLLEFALIRSGHQRDTSHTMKSTSSPGAPPVEETRTGSTS